MGGIVMNSIITKSKRFISVLLSLSIISSMFPQTWQIGYAESSDVAGKEIESQSMDNNSELVKQEFNGHLYSLIDEPMSWTEAKEYCENLGGYLAVITDEKEQHFIEDNILKSDTANRMYWIGGIQISGDWTWITGEPFDYTNWESAEPTAGNYQPYLQMYSPISRYDTGTWNNHINNDTSSYWSAKYTGAICEWESSNSELDYAVFSGSQTQGINLYGWKSRFDGNIYSGGGFNYGGSELYVTGRIDSAGAIITNGWITEIDERNEYIDAINMPDYDKAIHDNAEPYEYFEQSPAYVQDRNVINSSIKVGGDVVISGTTFEGDCYIIADGNIIYNHII